MNNKIRINAAFIQRYLAVDLKSEKVNKHISFMEYVCLPFLRDLKICDIVS